MQVNSVYEGSSLNFSSVKLSKSECKKINHYYHEYIKTSSDQSKMSIIGSVENKLKSHAKEKTARIGSFEDYMQDLTLRLLEGLEELRTLDVNPSKYLTKILNQLKPQENLIHSNKTEEVIRLSNLSKKERNLFRI